MAAETGDEGMPRPDITAGLSIDETCEVLGTGARREVIEQIAMRGWLEAEVLDADAIDSLEEWSVVRVRGKRVGRGENFEAMLRTLNAIAQERRDLR